MRIFESARRAEIGAEQPDLELILAVERQRGLQLDATDRPERETFDMAILGLILSDAEQLTNRRCLGITERESADALGRGQVAFKEYRRDAEHVCVVVEPAARI